VLALGQFAKKKAAVLKLYKETKTRAAARHCILADADFLWILRQACLGEDLRVVELARAFLAACCATEHLVSVHALFSLALQHFSEELGCKRAGLRVLEGLSHLALALKGDALVDLAMIEPRCIVHLVEVVQFSPQYDRMLRFLLGDTECVFDLSLLRSEFYRCGRVYLLSRLADDVSPYTVQLMHMYCKWNGYAVDFSELALLVPFIRCLGRNLKDKQSLRTFESAFEMLCDCFWTFGCNEAGIASIVASIAANDCCPDSVLFALGVLLLLKRVSVSLLFKCLELMQRRLPAVAVTVAVCHVGWLGGDGAEELCQLRSYLGAGGWSGVAFHQVEFANAPVTLFGHVVRFAAECAGSLDAVGETCVMLKNRMLLVRMACASVTEEELHAYMQGGGDFEDLFVMLSYLHYSGCWTGTRVFRTIAGLICVEVEDESAECKQLRLKWLLEYLLDHMETTELMLVVPTIAAGARESAVFAFVQRVLPRCELLNDGHFTYAATLALLLQVSETRHSRLQFLVLSSLSFLTKITTAKIAQVSPDALLLVFSLLKKLSLLAVIDPRQIWSKFAGYFMGSLQVVLRVALAAFVPAFNVIADKDVIDEIKADALSWLIESFCTASDELAFTVASSSLADVSTDAIRRVEYGRLVASRPVADEDGEVVVYEFEDVLCESVLFLPAELWAVGLKFAADPLKFESFRGLWASLVRFEVAHMPRPVFIGSTDSKRPPGESRSRPKLTKPASANSSFLATLLVHDKAVGIASLTDFVGNVLKPMVGFIPSLSQLSWLVRPFVGDFCLEHMRRALSMTDDVQILRKLTETDAIMEMAKSIMVTPQAYVNVCLAMSAMVSVLFERQVLSERNLFDGWLQKLSTMLSAYPHFRPLANNEDFQAAILVSLSMFSGRSVAVSVVAPMIEAVLSKKGLREASVAAMVAIEISPTALLQDYISTPSNAVKRRLCAMISLARRNESLEGVESLRDLALQDQTLRLGVSLWSPDLVKEVHSEPLEFKGLISILSARASLNGFVEVARERACSKSAIPATLKFESIIAALTSFKFDLIRWQFVGSNFEQFCVDLCEILDTTSDPKCVALLQSVLAANTTTASLNAERPSHCTRFSSSSHFSWIAGRIDCTGAMQVLNLCPVLPRFDWRLSGGYKDGMLTFLLQHTVSMTPVSNTLFVSELLKQKLTELLQSDCTDFEECDLRRLAEVMFYIFDKNQLTDYLRQVCLKEGKFIEVICKTEPILRSKLDLSRELSLEILDMILDLVTLNPGILTCSLLSSLKEFNLESLHFALCIIKAVQSKGEMIPALSKIYEQGSSGWQSGLCLLKAAIMCIPRGRRIALLVPMIEVGYIYQNDSDFMRRYTELLVAVLSDGTMSECILSLNMSDLSESEHVACTLQSSLSSVSYLEPETRCNIECAFHRAAFLRQSI